MKKRINILFVCKHNVFRSKVAEAYFKKINKNKNIKIQSAGIVESDTFTPFERKMIAFQKKTSKKFGIEFKAISKSLLRSVLKEQDLIIVVANDVPESIFKYRFDLKRTSKVIVWKIKDVDGSKTYKKIIENSIKDIIKKVDSLVKQLEKKK